MKKILTIAGSDSCGGAGIQADLKTFSAHGTYGMSVITAITAQNTEGVFAVEDVSPDIIKKQIEVLFDDICIDAIKIGMVSKVETINIIADTLKKYNVKNLVIDPVMVSKSGFHLLQPEAKQALIENLLPLATIVTPNLPEAEVITDLKVSSIKDMENVAIKIYEMGPKCVLVKGGHLEGDAVDILYDGTDFRYYVSPRIDTIHTHGTGCTLSSAIASNLSKGYSIDKAVEKSKRYITNAIKQSFSIGKGVGPVHHFYNVNYNEI